LTVGTHSKSGSFVLFLEQSLDVCKRVPASSTQSWRFLMMIMEMCADREEMIDTKERPKFIVLNDVDLL
jgi:hypothetical protein